MKKFKYMKPLCFFIILALTTGYAFHCYSFPKNYISRSYEAFYDEPKNLIDGVVFGTSVVANGWSAPVAWHEYGMPVYQLGGTVQPFGPLPQLIDFVRSRQDIKYVIIDIHALRTKTIKKSVRPENALRVSNSLHLGTHRYRVLQSSLDYAQKVYDFYGMPQNPEHILYPDNISNYVPFINFHNRRADGLEKADYISVPSEYKGALDDGSAFAVKDVSGLVDMWKVKPAQADTFQKEMLEECFRYLQENNIPALFISYPSFNTKKELGQLKAISQYIKDRGFPMIDMCSIEMLEEIGLDTRSDFRDESHLNSIGAGKATRYLCAYIKEHCYYKDHRGDRRYGSWDKAVGDYAEFLRNGWAVKGIDFHFII